MSAKNSINERISFASIKNQLEYPDFLEIQLKSFVFPKNRVGHTDLLGENEFIVYRGPQPCWFEDFPHLAWRVAHKIDAFSPIPPPVMSPERTGGVWNLPASFYYTHRDGWGRWLPIWMRVWKAKMGLRRAVRRKKVFHLWFHPYDLASDMDGLFRGLEEIFAEVSRLKSNGLLDQMTMGQMAECLTRREKQSEIEAL